MKYGFPQITNKRALSLLTGELESERKFEIIISENGRNTSLKRIVSIEKLDEPLTDATLDKSLVYSEITAQDKQPVDKRETLAVLKKFRSGIIELAKKYGYPEPFNRSVYGSKFNHDLTVLVWQLSQEFGMTPVNAASNGVWNFLQVVGCPSVACWRWENNGKTVLNRLIGSTRGAYGTAWWRYAVLTDFGREDYEDWIFQMSEDAIQNILERPGMRGYTPVIIPFAKKITTISHNDYSDPVRFIRAASIQLRIKSSTSNFWYLLKKDPKNAERIIDDVFDTTRRILEIRQ
jgi:hypothetical protein